MHLIRTWICTVTAAALVTSVALALMPPGAVKKVGQLTGGLILVLAVVQPLGQLDYQDLADLVEALPAGATVQTGPYSAMAPVIEEELAAYIAERAAQLGADCSAQVTCAPGENDVPLPREVTVTGDLTQAQRASLEETITQDLGLSGDSIRWEGTDKEETP
jgi:stage III sporulation protein AF